MHEHNEEVGKFRDAVNRLVHRFDRRMLENATRNIVRGTRSANSRAGDIRQRYRRALARIYDIKADCSALYASAVRLGLRTEGNIRTDHEIYEKYVENLNDHMNRWQIVLHVPESVRRQRQQPPEN